jgi:hypothetical protein
MLGIPTHGYNTRLIARDLLWEVVLTFSFRPAYDDMFQRIPFVPCVDDRFRVLRRHNLNLHSFYAVYSRLFYLCSNFWLYFQFLLIDYHVAQPMPPNDQERNTYQGYTASK